MYQAGQQDNEKISFRGHENLAPRESAHVLCAGIIRHEWVGNVDLPGVLERRCSNACGLFCVWFEPGIPASRAGIPAACSRPWRTGRLRRSPPPADRSLFLHFLSLHLLFVLSFYFIFFLLPLSVEKMFCFCFSVLPVFLKTLFLSEFF